MEKEKGRKPGRRSLSTPSISSKEDESQEGSREETEEYNSEDLRAWEEEQRERREEEEDADALLRSLENPSSSRSKTPPSSPTPRSRTPPRSKTPPRSRTPPRSKTPPRSRTPPRSKTPPSSPKPKKAPKKAPKKDSSSTSKEATPPASIPNPPPVKSKTPPPSKSKTPPPSKSKTPPVPPVSGPVPASTSMEQDFQVERIYPGPKKLFNNEEANELYNSMVKKYGMYEHSDIKKLLKLIDEAKDPYESKINGITSNLVPFSANEYQSYIEQLGKELITDNDLRNQNVIKLCRIVEHQNNIFMNTRNIKIFDEYLTNLKLFEAQREGLIKEAAKLKDKAKKSYLKSEMISSTFYQRKLLDIEPQTEKDVVKIQKELIALENKILDQVKKNKEYMIPDVYVLRLEKISEIERDTAELEQMIFQLDELNRKFELLKGDFEIVKKNAYQSSV